MGRASDAIEDWLGEPAIDFAVKSAGVGLSGTILNWVKAQGWAAGVGDEILQAVLGLAIRKYGDKVHEQLPNFGQGMLYQLAGRIISDNLSPLITKTMNKSGYPASAANHAFQQQYGRPPTDNEMALMQRAYEQKLAPTQQQPQQPQQQPYQQPGQQPTQPPMDLHYLKR